MRLPPCALLAWSFIIAATALAAEQPRALREAVVTPPPGQTWNEVSGMLPIRNPAFLEKGWAMGYWVILDEPPVENAIVRLGRRLSPDSPTREWDLQPVSVRRAGKSEPTGDCEAITRHGDTVYVFGSHFGRKKGPLDPERQFVARFDESALAPPETSSTQHRTTVIKLEVAPDHFVLHRLINDALLSSGLHLIARGPDETDKYIRKTLRETPTTAGLVREDDRAINIEGAAFLQSGAVLLGLRYPVTADGHPILIAVANIDALFAGGTPSVQAVWVLSNVGNVTQPAGIRELSETSGTIEVLTGNLDRFSHKKGESIVLDDHPEGIGATSRHWRFSASTLRSGSREIQAELVRDLSPHLNAEAIADDGHGGFIYGLDDNRVHILFP